MPAQNEKKKSTVLYMTGKARWAKLYVPDEYNGVKRWTMDFFPDPASLDRFKKSGLGLKIRRDEEGTFLRLRRPTTKVINGNVINLGPPEVVDAEENEFEEPVGNGSDVTVGVLVYHTRMGPGHQLEKVRVDRLVEYDGPTEQRMPPREALGAMDVPMEAVAQEPAVRQKVMETKYDDLDDEIPF